MKIEQSKKITLTRADLEALVMKWVIENHPDMDSNDASIQFDHPPMPEGQGRMKLSVGKTIVSQFLTTIELNKES